jgi:hypothetical protein
MPTDKNAMPRWPNYHSDIWKSRRSSEADLYFIDGRFRVACFAQVVLHCNENALIGFHDFKSRQHYHCVREIAREIATAEDMSFFMPLRDMKERASKMLEEFMFNPA